MLGSFLFRRDIRENKTAEDVLFKAAQIALCCFLVASMCADQSNVCPFQRQICFLAFLTLEMALGMYFPSIATLRSQRLPESYRYLTVLMLLGSVNTSICQILFIFYLFQIHINKPIPHSAQSHHSDNPTSDKTENTGDQTSHLYTDIFTLSSGLPSLIFYQKQSDQNKMNMMMNRNMTSEYE